MTALIGSGLALILLGAVAKAFALPIASSAAKGWQWLITLGLPADDKSSRRGSIASDLEEQRRDAHAAGYSPDSIALHVLWRMLLGIPADVSWRVGKVGVDNAVLAAAAILATGGLLVAHDASLLVGVVRIVLLAAAAGLVAAVLALRHLRFNSRRAPVWQPLQASPDGVLVSTAAVLVVVGLLAVFSASSSYFMIRQAGAAVLGLGLLWFFMRVDYHLLYPLSLFMMVLALVGLLAVLLPGIGVEQNGAHRWLNLGPLPPLQPSEFAKLAIIVYIAAWLASRRDDVKQFSMGFVPFTLMVGLVASLVVVEPDMGTTVVVVATTCTLFFLAGAPVSHLGLLVVSGGLMSCFLVAVTDWRVDHITAFLSPESDPEGVGFHITQLLNALGSGGTTGLGWGASHEHYMGPGGFTDSIFAVIAQDFGFVGIAVIIGLYFLLVYRGVSVAFAASDRFGTLLAAGVTCWIGYQVLINIGGITQSIPMTGIALPFISYGGSGLVGTLAGVGLLVNVSRRGHQHPRPLAAS
jgi:cell division protein FtsW